MKMKNKQTHTSARQDRPAPFTLQNLLALPKLDVALPKVILPLSDSLCSVNGDGIYAPSDIRFHYNPSTTLVISGKEKLRASNMPCRICNVAIVRVRFHRSVMNLSLLLILTR